MTRVELQRHLRRLAAFRDAIAFAPWVYQRKALLAALKAEQQVIHELWLTLPDDRRKQLRASNRRIQKAVERCLLFRVKE